MAISRQLKTGNHKPVSSSKHRVSRIRYRVSSIQHRASGIQLSVTGVRGFTLMEILLAFLILGIVMTTILASFNAVFSTTDNLKNSSEYYDMAKNCLNRMVLDLEAIYITQPPLYKAPNFDEPPDLYRIVGSSTEINGTNFALIRFASNAHIPFNK